MFFFSELHPFSFFQNNFTCCHLGPFPWTGKFILFLLNYSKGPFARLSGRFASTLAGAELLSAGRTEASTNGRATTTKTSRQLF
jgi:hypothetical protein